MTTPSTAMQPNSTAQSAAPVSPHHHPTTGRSVFWGLAAIALNAMVQPSAAGYYWSGDMFQDTLWPHRASPITCALDAVADIWIMVQKCRKNDWYRNSSAPAKPAAVAMRLAIFLVGALPQAIKLFCMRGIPITQALAAMFLVSTATSMARTLREESSAKDIVNFAAHSNRGSSSVGVFLLFYFLVGPIGPFINLLFAGFVWSTISVGANLNLDTSVVNVVQDLGRTASILSLVYTAQHIAITVLQGRWLLPVSIVPIMFWFANPTDLPQILRSKENRQSMGKGFMTRAALHFTLPFSLLYDVALCRFQQIANEY